jgi:DNA primase
VGRRGKPAPPEWLATTGTPRARRDEPVERALILAMLVDRDLVERIAERHGPSDFRDPNYGAIFSALLEGGHAEPLDSVASRLPSGALAVLRELTEAGDAHPPEAVDVSLSVARFAARHLEARIEEILRIMPTASTEEQTALMRERMDLEGERRRLLPIRSPRGKRRG